MGTATLANQRHIPREDYQTKPWKNGKGTTHDILILPEGGDHASFDVRLALSPIVEKGVFSSYEGADRVITLVEGAGLDLQFGASKEHLAPLQSLYFDTGLAPIGTPLSGPVRVINVMARRGVWNIATCSVASSAQLKCKAADMVFIYCIGQGCLITVDGTQTQVAQLNSVLLSDATNIAINGEGLFLFAHLKPHA